MTPKVSVLVKTNSYSSQALYPKSRQCSVGASGSPSHRGIINIWLRVIRKLHWGARHVVVGGSSTLTCSWWEKGLYHMDFLIEIWQYGNLFLWSEEEKGKSNIATISLLITYSQKLYPKPTIVLHTSNPSSREREAEYQEFETNLATWDPVSEKKLCPIIFV